MKTIKFLFFLIILGLLGLLVYQNQEYFLATYPLHIDFKISSWQYTAIPLANIAYWGICLGLGLLITGLRGLFTAFRLGREVKEKNTRIDLLKGEINTLKTELDVYIHDPYIKKHLENQAASLQDAPENAAAENAEAKEEVQA
ncbi:MAG: hypothetical protein HUK40_17100 [Desulfobacter sp.]|nr:hypothetical protein [Desulfobacter sp.]WDP86928.1 MAG: hypothetical protein HUN05_18855 [Desulfobacter sp.]